MLCKKNMCAHKLFTYSIRALIIKHSSEHIAKFEATKSCENDLYKISITETFATTAKEPVCKE